jgi:hypothetical protein
VAPFPARSPTRRTIPNPLEYRYALTNGNEGLFTDAGIADAGAHFDFDFGTVAPGQTKTFYLYWGATLQGKGLR